MVSKGNQKEQLLYNIVVPPTKTHPLVQLTLNGDSRPHDPNPPPPPKSGSGRLTQWTSTRKNGSVSFCRGMHGIFDRLDFRFCPTRCTSDAGPIHSPRGSKSYPPSILKADRTPFVGKSLSNSMIPGKKANTDTWSRRNLRLEEPGAVTQLQGPAPWEFLRKPSISGRSAWARVRPREDKRPMRPAFVLVCLAGCGKYSKGEGMSGKVSNAGFQPLSNMVSESEPWLLAPYKYPAPLSRSFSFDLPSTVRKSQGGREGSERRQNKHFRQAAWLFLATRFEHQQPRPGCLFKSFWGFHCPDS